MNFMQTAIFMNMALSSSTFSLSQFFAANFSGKTQCSCENAFVLFESLQEQQYVVGFKTC
jgi:hypothetical protein